MLTNLFTGLIGQASLPVTRTNTMLQLMCRGCSSNTTTASLALSRRNKNGPLVVTFSALSAKPVHVASMKPVDLQPSKTTSNVPPLADVTSPSPLLELHVSVVPLLLSSKLLPRMI